MDLSNSVQTSFATPRTEVARRLPILGRLEIRIPKWPGSTLAGTHGIEIAASMLRIKEDAVTGTVLFQALAKADLADKHGLELFDSHVHILRHRGDFCLIDPDKAGAAGAATAALRAFKL